MNNNIKCAITQAKNASELLKCIQGEDNKDYCVSNAEHKLRMALKYLEDE